MSILQPLVAAAQPHWQHYVCHPFVEQLAQGTLNTAAFRHYLKQDYRYLLQYNRALALAMYKSDTFAQMDTIRDAINLLFKEIQLHIGYCRSWGVSEAELAATPESAACVAYTRYVLDAGMAGSLAELYAALLPCAAGYAEIGKGIADRGISPPDNPYQNWIDAYAAEDFQTAAHQMADTLTQLCIGLGETQMQKIRHIFTTATRMEIAFWQMGLDQSE